MKAKPVANGGLVPALVFFMFIVAGLRDMYAVGQPLFHIAPVVVESDGGTLTDEVTGQFHRELYYLLVHAPRPRGYALALADVEAPLSVLDVMGACAHGNYRYLFYGYLRDDGQSLALELRLYDALRHSIALRLFCADDRTHYQRLVQSAADRLHQYMEQDLGLGPDIDSPAKHNGFRLVESLGYWTYLNEAWAAPGAGVITLRSGIRLTPQDPGLTLFHHRAIFYFGADLLYALGVNRREYESSRLHSIELGLLTGVSLQIAGEANPQVLSAGVHRFGLEIGPLLAAQVLSQDRKYQGAERISALAPGAMLALEYRYAFDSRSSIGLSNTFSVLFHQTPAWRFSPGISIDIGLGQQNSQASEGAARSEARPVQEDRL